MIAFKLSLWLIFIAVEAHRNYYLIEIKKERPIYSQSFIIRGLAGLIYGILFFNPQSMLEYLPVFLYQLSSFYLLFDLTLNILRSKPLLYVGEHSGWFFDNIGQFKGPYILLKISTLLVLFESLRYVLIR